MTCEEAARLFHDKQPTDCTLAEVAAVIAHVNKCSACQDHWRQFDDGRKPTPESAAVVDRILADPESRAVWFGEG